MSIPEKRKPLLMNNNYRLSQAHIDKVALIAERTEVNPVDVIRWLIDEAKVPPAKKKTAKKAV